MAVMKRALDIIINLYLWIMFTIFGAILFLGACFIWLLTFSVDPNRRVLQQYTCLWSTIYLWCNPYWSVTVRGLEHVDRRKAYVIIANHQSMADIIVVFRSFLHFKWVSKQSMFNVPFLGWNMWLNGYIPIARGDAESRETCLRHCREWLAKGSSVFFFPEGTRSSDGVMRPFKLGAFQLALDTKTDILPMAISGSHVAIPKKSIVLNRKAAMSLCILPPIAVIPDPTRPLDEQAQDLADEARRRLQAALSS